MQKTVYLVDDELLALQEMEVMLKPFSELKVIGKSARVEEAVRECNDLNPDLIILDINMPGMDGFQFLESLNSVNQVIFVTAYDQYAIKAFEINALDYLLKPVNPLRLQDAIRRFLLNSESEHAPSQKLSLDKKIFIKDGDSCYFVAVHKIFLLESVGNYVRVHFEDQKPLLHKSLSYLEERLPEDLFFRANRQFIFNLDFVKKIEPYFNSTLMIHLNSGHQIDLSQRQSVRFRDLTGI